MRAAANKDGGAHVDAALPGHYEWLIEGGGFGVEFSQPDGTERKVDLAILHLASLRQMGYEVVNSPALVKLASGL